jgi:excisionase family DNA binding protein
MAFDILCSKDFKTISELASEWRVSVPHIHNLINRKQLPAHKIGARIIIKRADAQRFLEQHATAKVAA